MPSSSTFSTAPSLDDLKSCADGCVGRLPESDEEIGAFRHLVFRTSELGAPGSSPGDATPIVFLECLGERGREVMSHFAARYLAGHSNSFETETGRIYLRAFGYSLVANASPGGDPEPYTRHLERLFSWALRVPEALLDDEARPNALAQRVAGELRAFCDQCKALRPEHGGRLDTAMQRVFAPWMSAIKDRPGLSLLFSADSARITP